MSADGRQQFIPPLTPIAFMRQLGANIRMKDSGDVLEIEDDHGTTHTEKLVRERSGHVHNQLDFSREGWKLPDSLRAQLKFDPFMASNRHEQCSYGTYEFCRGNKPCTSYSRSNGYVKLLTNGYDIAYNFTHNNITLDHNAMNNNNNTIAHMDVHNTQY